MKETYFIRFAVYMVSMGVMYVILDRIKNRSSLTQSNDSTNYIVKMPAVLGVVYLVLFFFGVLLFGLFLVLKLRGNPSITAGSFRLCVIISAIGLLVMLWSVKWHITVQDTLFTFESLFKKKETISVYDLDQARIGAKDMIILYRNGKKIAEVDALCDNYSLFANTLRKYGKLSD